MRELEIDDIDPKTLSNFSANTHNLMREGYWNKESKQMRAFISCGKNCVIELASK